MSRIIIVFLVLSSIFLGCDNKQVEIGDKLEIYGIAMVESLNRNGTIVNVESLEQHFTRPVPLVLDHNYHTSQVIGKVYAVEKIGPILTFHAEMLVTEENYQVAQKLMNGYINSVSIGLSPLDIHGYEVYGELIEISLVVVPAVKDAKIIRVEIQ